MKKRSKVVSGVTSYSTEQFEDAIRTKQIDDFQKATAIEVLQLLMRNVTKNSFSNIDDKGNRNVRLVGKGTFKIPKDVNDWSGLMTWITRKANSSDNVDWLLKNVKLVNTGKVTAYAKATIPANNLAELKAKAKQTLEDTEGNKWFFSLFDKLRQIGGVTMSTQQLCCLSFIAKAGTNGATTADIVAALDTGLSSIQRQLGRLAKGYTFKTGGKGDVREREGLNLIEEFENPLNRKQKRWVLTAEGVKFFKQLNSVV